MADELLDLVADELLDLVADELLDLVADELLDHAAPRSGALAPLRSVCYVFISFQRPAAAL